MTGTTSGLLTPSHFQSEHVPTPILTAHFIHLVSKNRMLEDVLAVSLPCQKIDYVRDDLSPVGGMDAGDQVARYGYQGLLITRPAFYNVLLSRVPPNKIQWGKRILGFEQNQYGVMIRVADGTTHHGDILIGAGKSPFLSSLWPHSLASP